MLSPKDECILLKNHMSTFDGDVHRVRKGKNVFRHNALHTEQYECVYERTGRTVTARKEDHPGLDGGEKMPVFVFVGIQQKLRGRKNKRRRAA